MIYNENGENLICVDNQCMLMEAFISDKYNEKLNELNNLIKNLNSTLTKEDFEKINDAVLHKKYLKGIEICTKITKILKVITIATGGAGIIFTILEKSMLSVISFTGLFIGGIGWLITKGIKSIYKKKDNEVYIKNLEVILNTLKDLKNINNDDKYKQIIQDQINQISEYMKILSSIKDQVDKDEKEIDTWIARYQLEEIYDKNFETTGEWIYVPTEDNKYNKVYKPKSAFGTVGVITNIIESSANHTTAECVIYGYPIDDNKAVTFSYTHTGIITDMIPYNKSTPVKMLTAPNKAKATFIFNDNYQIRPEEIFIAHY